MPRLVIEDEGLYYTIDGLLIGGTVPPDPIEPPETGELVYVTPSFELGASSEDPTVDQVLAWYTSHQYTNGVRIELELYIENSGGSPGVGTGSYEIYLPEGIEPATDIFSGHANLWIGGGGRSEFDGSVKWTFRNEAKGPKLIFTFDGTEWGPTSPKNWNKFKLRANINYWL